MIKKTPTGLLILIIILIIGFAGYFWFANNKSSQKPAQNNNKTTAQKEAKPSDETLLEMDSASVEEKTKENLDLATEKALQWRNDATLVYLQVKLESLKQNDGTEIYVFDSPSLPKYHFAFTIAQETKRYIRAIIPTEDYLGTGLLPIDPKYWKVNYVSALQIAEKEGGRDFRTNHSDWTIELNLKRTTPKNWLYWIIDYKTKEGDSLSVKINSFSGEVIKEESEGT